MGPSEIRKNIYAYLYDKCGINANDAKHKELKALIKNHDDEYVKTLLVQIQGLQNSNHALKERLKSFENKKSPSATTLLERLTVGTVVEITQPDKTVAVDPAFTIPKNFKHVPVERKRRSTDV